MMKTIAKKIFTRIVFSSLFVFAVSLGFNVSTSAAEYKDFIKADRLEIEDLDSENFWDKFRDSIMKNRKPEERTPEDPPPVVERQPEQPIEEERH